MNYDELERLVKDEIRQKGEEGCDVSEVRSALARIKGRDPSSLKAIMESLSKLEARPDFPYREPSNLAEIRNERPKGPRMIATELSEDELLNKIRGGWLGRCAGCLLGSLLRGSAKDRSRSG